MELDTGISAIVQTLLSYPTAAIVLVMFVMYLIRDHRND